MSQGKSSPAQVQGAETPLPEAADVIVFGV